MEMISAKKGVRSTFLLKFPNAGAYKLEITVRANAQTELAQIPVSVFTNEIFAATISLTGADKEWRTVEVPLGEVKDGSMKVAFFFGKTGMEIAGCKVVSAY